MPGSFRMIVKPMRSEIRASRSGLSWFGAIANWVPSERTSSYSRCVKAIVDPHAMSLHSQT
jgi:hypothetical protein